MMNAHSSEKRPVHPGDTHAVIRRATTRDAAIVTNFLHEQAVRPPPREADLVAFLGRNDAALFYALLEGRMAGTAGCARDQSVLHLVHFAIEPSLMDALAALLLSAVENYAREQGAALMMAELPHDSKQIEHLRACGYEVDCEESQAIAGRVVTIVDLIKKM